jgi:hypothetical protein
MLSNLTLQVRDLFASSAKPIAGALPRGEFVKGINLGGTAVTIEGNLWDSYEQALASGLTIPEATAITTAIVPVPYAPPPLRQMLNSAVCNPQTLELNQTLPNGTYDIYLWVIENYKTNWHSIQVQLNGQSVATQVGKLPLNNWARYGPYQTTITDGLLTLSLSTGTPTVDAHLMGLSMFRLK